jgi:hypothetical protein
MTQAAIEKREKEAKEKRGRETFKVCGTNNIRECHPLTPSPPSSQRAHPRPGACRAAPLPRRWTTAHKVIVNKGRAVGGAGSSGRGRGLDGAAA